MDAESYDAIRDGVIELERLASENGINILKRAAHIYPKMYSQWVASNASFDTIIFEEDTVRYSRWSSGDVDYEYLPVHFLWTPDWEAEVLAQKTKDEVALRESERRYREEEALRKKEAAENAEKEELRMYRRLKRKYEKKP